MVKQFVEAEMQIIKHITLSAHLLQKNQITLGEITVEEKSNEILEIDKAIAERTSEIGKLNDDKVKIYEDKNGNIRVYIDNEEYQYNPKCMYFLNTHTF